MVKVYVYKTCSTCRKATAFLKERGVAFVEVPIVDQPPPQAELTTMLAHLRRDGRGLKHLFNTSGERYRALGVADKLKAGLSDAAAIGLLASDGKLIKRPFLLTAKDGTVGFDAEVWARVLDLKIK